MSARMRTIRQAVAELNAVDKGNGLSEYALRHLIKLGEIKVIIAGSNRVLVNMDLLEAYLAGETTANIDQKDRRCGLV